VRDVLRLLNDRSTGDLRELNDEELQRFEALCEQWRGFAAQERSRRSSEPRASRQ
jgi:hypothetical protein